MVVPALLTMFHTAEQAQLYTAECDVSDPMRASKASQCDRLTFRWKYALQDQNNHKLCCLTLLAEHAVCNTASWGLAVVCSHQAYCAGKGSMPCVHSQHTWFHQENMKHATKQQCSEQCTLKPGCQCCRISSCCCSSLSMYFSFCGR